MPKTALVTGASGALGASVIDAFAGAGWQLALVAHSEEGKAQLAVRYPESLALQADLRKPDSAQGAVQVTLERYGTLDAVLNLAGGFGMKGARELTASDVEKQLALNLSTAVNATQAALPHLLARGEGFVAGIAAAAARDGGAKMAAYAAAKAALAGYLKSLAKELEPQGIAVTVVYPMGALDTPSNRRSMPKADPSSWIDPEDVARGLLFAAQQSPRGRVRELVIYPPTR
jgi:NAD(P)-dependent dehydrogenase (short-subunit alcohol dehydrogenase family)